MSDPFDRMTYSYTDFGLAKSWYGGYVVSGTNELVATPNGNGVVQISAGEAVASYTYYTNDAGVDIAITAAANNRIDRIVLRYSAANRTVRLTKIIGTPAANPSPPNFTLGDLPLWWIWVPAGYNPATTPINAEDIHDERQFMNSSYSAVYGRNLNLMPNSEFMAFSAATLGTDAPEFWRILATPTGINAAAARPQTQQRGNAVRIRGDAGDGMQTTFNLGVETLTLKGSVNIASGSVRITAGTTVKDFYRTGVDQEFVIRFSGNNPGISIEAHAAGSDFAVSQLLLVEGYVPGGFRPKHELIMLDYAVTDASWSNTAKSTGLTTIDLGASFGALIPYHVRGLIVKLRGRDSGSAAGTAELYVTHGNNSTPTSVLYLSGEPNDDYREIIGYVPCYAGVITNSFRIGVTATGAGTLDATVEIIGIIT